MAYNEFVSGKRMFGFENVGRPYVKTTGIPSSSFGTGNGQVQFEFPYISRSVRVINDLSGTNVQVNVHPVSALSGNVINGGHYIPLKDYKDEITLNWALERIYVSLASGSSNGHVTVIADLTMLPVTSGSAQLNLTGSGLTD